jgi:M6 family metalloprotease-like protein
MKKLIFILFAVFCLSLMANLVENKPYEHTQPDGTVLNLLVSGDEYYHRVHDANGYTILLHPQTGFAVYAVNDGNSIKESDYVVGTVDPSTLGIQPNLVKKVEETVERTEDNIQVSHTGNRASPTGIVNNIVVFVRFNDQFEFPTTPTYTWYNNLFNSSTQQSLWDYYDEVSTGQLDINTYLYSAGGSYVVSVQVANNRGYYSPYNATTNPGGYQNNTEKNNRHWALFGELVALTDPLVPAGIDIDTDDDSINDALTFIIRGATDGWGDILWPTHYSWGASNGSINGIPVWHYVFDFEGGLGSSVICHEMGHMIGFPDLYHYTNNGIAPVGGWSLMASDNTQHELVYEKYKYGTWCPPISVITATSTPIQYTLTAIDQNPYSAYIIASNYANQFYVVEYRRQTGRYEAGAPATGLIVYRVLDYYPLVGGVDIRGNAGGPPDELYVYRPGGDIDTNGTVNSANFSSTVGRTAIYNSTDPKPWLYVNTTTQVDGDLVITDVGASGGTTITFTLRDSAPNIWDGSTSTAWNTAANWSLNSVPTSVQDVEIPAGMPRYPVVSIDQYCRRLTVKSGASVFVSNGTLYVETNFENSGALAMSSSTAYLFISGSLYFRSGSSTSITAEAGIYIQGNVEFHIGSSVNMSSGFMQFFGTGYSFIRTYTPTAINNFVSNKDDTYYTSFSNLSSSTLTLNGYIRVYAGSTAYNAYAGTTIIKGNIYIYFGGMLYCSAGTISFEGSSTSYVFTQGTDYFSNFTVNKPIGYSVVLNSNVDINGSLSILSGIFSALSQTIYLAGDWINNVGESAFTEGTSRVIFNGGGHQYCNYTETFNIIEVNKSGGALRVNNSTAVVTCAAYDWTVGAVDILFGTFTASDLIDDGLYGSYYVNPGATINLTNTDGYVDLNGNLIFSGGGTINVYGGTTDSYWPYAGNASISMSGGTLDFKDRGVYLFTTGSYTLDIGITGGTIRTSGGFYGTRTDFDPTGGKVELYGSIDASVSLGTGSYFNNLHINKSAAREDDDNSTMIETDRFGHSTEIHRTNTMTLSSNIVIKGYFWIQTGTFSAASYQMNVAGDWWNYVGTAGFAEGTSLVVFDGAGNSAINAVEDFNNLEINKTGTAYVNVNTGYSAVSNSYNWTSGKLYITGGTFTALDLADDAILGSIELTAGFINYHQDPGQYIDLRGDVIISGGEFHLYGTGSDSVWPWGGNASLTMSNGVLDVHDRLVYVYSANTFTTNITGGTIKVAKGFWCDRPDFNPAGGFFEMYSTEDAYLNMIAGSLYNLRINKGARSAEEMALIGTKVVNRDREGNQVELTRSNTVTALSNLDINGYFYLISGAFNSPEIMNVRSHWYNDVGAGGFNESDNLVIFDSDLNSVCNGETFYNLELNKTGTFYLRMGTGSTVICTSYNWTSGKLYVNGGTFTALDMADDAILGTLELTSGYIHFYQDTAQYLDLRGDVIISGGELHLYGINGDTYWPYAGNASLVMSDGLIDVHDTGIRISAGNTFTTNITGGIIRTTGYLTCQRADFNPIGGYIEMYGSNDASIYFSAGTLYHLYVNKGTREASGNQRDAGISVYTDREGNVTELTRSNTVILGSNITCTNDLTIQSGTLNLNGYTVNITYDLRVYGTLLMANAADHLIAGDDIFWYGTAVAGVTQGILEAGGNWYVYSGANVILPNTVTTYLRTTASKLIYLGATGTAFGNLILSGAGTNATYSIHPSSIQNLLITGNLTIAFGYELDIATVNASINGNLDLNGRLDIHESYVEMIGKPDFASTSNLTIDTGTFIFYDSTVPRNTSLAGVLSINSGTFEAVNNTLTVLSGSATALASGWIICDGITATFAQTFQPAGGTVKFTSNMSGGYQGINVSNGNFLPSVILDTTTGISLAAVMTITGNLTLVDGVFKVNGFTLSCDGNINVNNGGTLELYHAAQSTNLSMKATKVLNVNSGGIFYTFGSTTFSNLITNSTGYTTFNVESGGSITAYYSIFEKMDAQGVHVKSGASINPTYPFTGCTFRIGVAGGALLTLNNDQNLFINNAAFPNNTWAGSSNVKKTINAGLVNFGSSTGGFSGEVYDDDYYNRIFWTTTATIPDLQIVKAVWSDLTPDIGETVYLTVTYLNASTTAAGSNYLDLYYNRLSAPGTGLRGDMYTIFPNVPAGVPAEYVFSVLNADPGNAGLWNSWLQIDTNQQVTEVNEANNLFGPFNINWIALALPAITDLTIERIPGTNNIRLDWTYSTVVTRFKIYRSTDPGFTPGPANLLTTVAYPTTEYTGAASVAYYFYIVTAELDPPVREAVSPPGKIEPNLSTGK